MIFIVTVLFTFASLSLIVSKNSIIKFILVGAYCLLLYLVVIIILVWFHNLLCKIFIKGLTYLNTRAFYLIYNL